jgi:hypothetical protein
MITIPHILLGLGLAAGYCLFALARPVGTCWRCHGKRNQRNGRRTRTCPACRGKGWAPTPGAEAIHQVFHELAGAWVRARLKKKGERK